MKNDPFYELIMNEYNSQHIKQQHLREALIFHSIIKDKLPLLKLYLDKQTATKKVDTIDEEKFYQWLLLMRKADEILDGQGLTVFESVQNTPKPEPDTVKVEQMQVTPKAEPEPEQVKVTPDKIGNRTSGRETFSSIMANANKQN